MRGVGTVVVEKPFLGELHLPLGGAGQGVEGGEAVLKVTRVEVSAVQVLLRPANIVALSIPLPDQCFVVELFCDLRGWTPCAEMARARKVTQAAIFLLWCAYKCKLLHPSQNHPHQHPDQEHHKN